jgi:hypothetical protein
MKMNLEKNWIIHELNNIVKNVGATIPPQRLAILTRMVKSLENKINNYDPWIEVNPSLKDGCAEIKSMNLPEENKGILVLIPKEDNHVTAGMWDHGKWVILDDYRTLEIDEVSHWMNSPKLPKQEKNEY